MTLEEYEERELAAEQTFLRMAGDIHDELDQVSVELLELKDIIDSRAVDECEAHVKLALIALEKEL